MSTYLIAYDLKQPAAPNRYEALSTAIKSYGTWAHVTESCWAIETEQTATQVRDFLLKLLNAEDRLFVLKSAKVAAWNNTICRNEWLKEHI